MRDSEQMNPVLDALQKARGMELLAVHQYMNQHYNLSAMDYGDLAANIKRIAIDEMQHAERFAERIRELEKQPSGSLPSPIAVGQGVGVIYSFDVNLEANTLEKYNDFLAICQEQKDFISSSIFREILQDEQKHYDYFVNTQSHLACLGDAFLAKVAGTDGDTGESKMGFIKR